MNRRVSLILLLGIVAACPYSAVPSASKLGVASTGEVQRNLRSQPVIASSSAATLSNISADLGQDLASYVAHEQVGGFHMDNRRHEIAADFTATGVELRCGAARWGMSLLGYGYGRPLRASRPEVPEANSNRVKYQRGSLTEWYLNGPLGLEQGFTIRRPPGAARGRLLTIALALSGNLSATPDDAGTGLALTGQNVRLRYSGLTAYDDRGKKLPAQLEVKGKQLLLKVRDTGARYPLLIDPFVQQAEVTTSDVTSFDDFGESVSTNGNTIAVASASTGGAVYIFVEPSGGWHNTSKFTAKLTASDGGTLNRVSLVGTTLVASSLSGAAYVYVMPVGGWVTTNRYDAKLTSDDGAAFTSVSTSGNVVVAGAPTATGANSEQGAAYIFVEPANGWSDMYQTAKLTASDGVTDDRFGVSVGVNGATVLVGAPAAMVGCPSNCMPYGGAAYVFVKPATGWVDSHETAKLTASTGEAGDNFGESVSTNGETALIGASQRYTETGNGKAFIFLKPPTGGWVTTSKYAALLTASDGRKYDYFGANVSMSGTVTNTAVVGAFKATIGPRAGQGAAYVFVKPPSGWVNMNQTAKLVAGDGNWGDEFGTSTAINGSTVVVSAPLHKVGSKIAGGTVYIY